MQAVVGRSIAVKNYTPQFFAEVKRRFTFPNPEYYKRERMGKYTGGTPKELWLYERKGDALILPFGCLHWIFENRNRFECISHVFKMPQNRFDYKSNINTYPYQEKAVKEALKARNGIIVAPCGSGKTQIALEIAARLGMRMLWITHTQDLLRQSMNRAKSVYGLSGDDYGTITNGKVDCGNVVTFATVQTLANIDLSQYRDYWQVVIVDECHKAVGTPTKLMMFWKAVSSLAARYKFGVTATPKRTDGLEPAMYALLGDLIYEVPKEAVEDTTCPVHVVAKPTEFMPVLGKIVAADGTIDHNRLLDEIVHDLRRNALICTDADECEKPCMILTDRVAHVKMLQLMLGDNVRILCGSEKKKDREQALDDIKNGVADILIATYPIAKEGLDIPQLRTLIMATPSRNEITVTQSCGRVGRAFEGKERGVVYDYVDKCPILLRGFDARKKIYKRQKYILHFDT